MFAMRCQSSDGLAEITPRGVAEAQTVVLVGKTGNGKGATGNSIIGRQVFESMPRLGGVSSTCELVTTVLDNGRILNVIDTPGEPHEMAKEIAKYINMAKDGIHAFLLVLSLRSRFSEEEASAFESLLEIFGGKIADYMIVVFAHGDFLRNDQCLDDLFGGKCPKKLKSILEMCGNRRVLFDNMTEDTSKISRQRKQLLSLVETVVEINGGKPYTNDLFDKGEKNLIDQSAEGKSSEEMFHASSEEQFYRFMEMVELRVIESFHNLEKQLAVEMAARMEADVKALVVQTKSKNGGNHPRGRSMHRMKSRLINSLKERAARMEAEMKALSLQTKANGEVLELKKCLNTAVESCKQLEERLDRVESIHNLEKQLAEQRAARMEAEMKALSLQTKSNGEVLELKNTAVESRKQLEERLDRVESIHNLEKQLVEERASRLEAETKSKDEVLELKECVKRAEESQKQLEESLHRVEINHNLEKQLVEERASRLEAETKSKDQVLELMDCLNRAVESRNQLEERLHRLEDRVGQYY